MTMTDATKAKLSKWVKDEFVRDLLEARGILYPHQVKALPDVELERAGLRPEEIAAVREKLPGTAES